MGLPETLTTEALDLRRWDNAFALEMVKAVNVSLAELRAWMPWAQGDTTVGDMRIIFSKSLVDFEQGKAWNYCLFEKSSGELVGSAGLHREEDPDCPEIGYWIRTDRTRRGYATQAARALAQAAFAFLGDVHRVKICVDQANTASAAVARKLGFHFLREEVQAIEATAHTGTVAVWVIGRDDVALDAY